VPTTSRPLVEAAVAAAGAADGRRRAEFALAERNRAALGATVGAAHPSTPPRPAASPPPPVGTSSPPATLSMPLVEELAAAVAAGRRRLADAEAVWRLVLLEQAARSLAIVDPLGSAAAAGRARDGAFAAAASEHRATDAGTAALGGAASTAVAVASTRQRQDDETDAMLALLRSCRPPTRVFTAELCERFASRLAAGRRRCRVAERDARAAIVALAAATATERARRADVVRAEAQWRAHVAATMTHHRPRALAAEAASEARRSAAAAALARGPVAALAEAEWHGRVLLARADAAWRDVAAAQLAAGPHAGAGPLSLAAWTREARLLAEREDGARAAVAAAELRWREHVVCARDVARRRLAAA